MNSDSNKCVAHSNENAAQLMEVFSRFAKADWRKSTRWGLKASEVRVLLAIKKRNDQGMDRGISVSELSKILQVTSPTVTQMINSLIKGGYILRSIHPTDRRISEITLTEKGEQIAQEAMSEFRAIFTGLIDHLGKEQSDQLISILNQAIDYLQNVNKTGND
ncbi:hypothetical protein CIG75_10675 [Tumebacillus algifaecis]|uniref:HTH marR-type domain-containing protein n=1 Tax=Tumebacillus algifaecis TaxID=1214604 RepID=A0A223D220_9BACL|nr:MarR family transcriptional regulator [Tumebacillus algifaecis]ASS75407.1 hypothetical protein CIG75_10675 [Tumebacillus algifaecis]